MKKTWITTTILGVTMATAMSAQARDVKYMLPVSAALESPSAAGKLDNSVKFFFGPQAYPASAQKLGMVNSTGKVRIENKVDIPSCQASFIEALQILQNNAKAAGANAVVNIGSYYKNGAMVSSATEFECHAGSFSTILMLKGELVKLADK